jgi:hypothetical protein
LGMKENTSMPVFCIWMLDGLYWEISSHLGWYLESTVCKCCSPRKSFSIL